MHEFQHRGRAYSLFKREPSADAPYYLRVQHSNRRRKQSLGTSNRRVALVRAKSFLDALIEDKWSEVERLRSRRTAPTLGEVAKVYLSCHGIGRRSALNNVLELRKVVARTLGLNPDTAPLTALTASVAADYQNLTAQRYAAAAGLSEEAQREARERALRSSRSSLIQARSLFKTKGAFSLLAKYSEAGLELPESVREFAACPLRGRASKSDYLCPPDAVVSATLERIEALRESDPNVYKAFWLALGAGLRKSEIARATWECLVERDGLTWVSGGVGKDGKRIEVPMQSRAVKALEPFRQASGPIVTEYKDRWAKRLNGWMTGMGWRTQKKMGELRAYVGSLIYRESPMASMKFMRHKTIRTTETFYVRYGSVRPVDVL